MIKAPVAVQTEVPARSGLTTRPRRRIGESIRSGRSGPLSSTEGGRRSFGAVASDTSILVAFYGPGSGVASPPAAESAARSAEAVGPVDRVRDSLDHVPGT